MNKCDKCGRIYDDTFADCPHCSKAIDKEIKAGCANGLIMGLSIALSIVNISILPFVAGIVICFIISVIFKKRKSTSIFDEKSDSRIKEPESNKKIKTKHKKGNSTMLVPGNLIIQEKFKSKTSNNEYDVFIFDNCIACTCPAGGKKQLCKHLISVIHKNLETINRCAPEFCKQLVSVIELKQNKNATQAEKLKEYAKLIYSNKEIATAAHKNEQEIKYSDIRELEEISELFQNDRWLAVNFYDFLKTAQKEPHSIFAAFKTKGLEQLEKMGYIQWCNLDKYCNNYTEAIGYCAFCATELLVTNAKVAGFSRGFKNFIYEKFPEDIGIKLLTEDYSIIT